VAFIVVSCLRLGSTQHWLFGPVQDRITVNDRKTCIESIIDSCISSNQCELLARLHVFVMCCLLAAAAVLGKSCRDRSFSFLAEPAFLLCGFVSWASRCVDGGFVSLASRCVAAPHWSAWQLVADYGRLA